MVCLIETKGRLPAPSKKQLSAGVTRKEIGAAIRPVNCPRKNSSMQFPSSHGQISFRSGENLFPISPILEPKLSNFTLIILEDIYIYLFFHISVMDYTRR